MLSRYYKTIFRTVFPPLPCFRNLVALLQYSIPHINCSTVCVYVSEGAGSRSAFGGEVRVLYFVCAADGVSDGVKIHRIPSGVLLTLLT